MAVRAVYIPLFAKCAKEGAPKFLRLVQCGRVAGTRGMGWVLCMGHPPLAAFQAYGHGGILSLGDRRTVRASARMPTLATMRLSRRWGTRILPCFRPGPPAHPSFCRGVDLGHLPLHLTFLGSRMRES
jgi:hypothetical protein